jgi:hypothetical protein
VKQLASWTTTIWINKTLENIGLAGLEIWKRNVRFMSFNVNFVVLKNKVQNGSGIIPASDISKSLPASFCLSAKLRTYRFKAIPSRGLQSLLENYAFGYTTSNSIKFKLQSCIHNEFKLHSLHT